MFGCSTIIAAAIGAVSGIVGVLVGAIVPARIALRRERRRELHAALTAMFDTYLHFYELQTPETLADAMAALEAPKLLVRPGDSLEQQATAVQTSLQGDPIDFAKVNDGYALLRQLAWNALKANNPRGSWKIRRSREKA